MQMPNENIDTTMFAPCGMNCKVCYKHCYHTQSHVLFEQAASRKEALIVTKI